jgi:protein-disulfide isomerase
LRNLYIALAAMVIIGGAGAVYVASNGGAATKAGVAATASGPAKSAISEPSPATTQTAQTPDLLAPGPEDHVLGAADAPVTIIEYASYTCPHCADFHVNTLPRLKSDFIDKGQVRLVFREFVRNGLDVKASQLIRCAPAETYFNLVDVLFRSQDSWAFVQNPLDALKQIGRTAGLEPAKIDQCFADEAFAGKLVDGTKAAYDDLNVEATPTFFVNGAKSPSVPYEDYEDGGEKKPGLASTIRSLLPQP